MAGKAEQSREYVSRLFDLFDQTRQSNTAKGIDYVRSLPEDTPSQLNTTEYGWWTLQKHMFLQSYLWPFFAIGSRHFRRIVYIDMFAGPGLNLIREENDWYVTPGSPLIAYTFCYRPKKEKRVERFDSYYFFEKDASRASILERRLKKIAADFGHQEVPNILHRDSPSEIWTTMSNEVGFLNQPKKTSARPEKGLLFLIFIDPEGLDLDWDILRKLIRRYISHKDEKSGGHYTVADIIYTIPTGPLKRSDSRSFERTFGIKGVNPKWLSGKDIIELIHSKMKEEVGPGIYIETVPVYNTKNALLYNISLITKTTGAINATKAIIEKFEKLRLDPKQIANTIRIIHGKYSSLDAFLKDH